MSAVLIATTIAFCEMNKWGLYPSWTFAFDNAKLRAGACFHRSKKITLSRHFVENNSKEAVLDTLRHEIAHALAGPKAHHGQQWKVLAVKVGANPTRCYDSTVEMPKGNITADCCGVTYHRYRAPRKNARSYQICRSCRRRLSWRLQE